MFVSTVCRVALQVQNEVLFAVDVPHSNDSLARALRQHALARPRHLRVISFSAQLDLEARNSHVTSRQHVLED